MKKTIKNEKAITLIALVVTIIVLIILAGVSINLLLGQNGIIKKAQEAKKEQEIGEILEKLELKKAELAIDTKGTLILSEYIEKIQNDEDMKNTVTRSRRNR